MRNYLYILLVSLFLSPLLAEEPVLFPGYPQLDTMATGEWWKKAVPGEQPNGKKRQPAKKIIPMNVERDKVVSFALYTVADSTLKLTAQLYPLMPDEARIVRLETKQGETWTEIAQTEIVYPGWSAHFRVKDWDHSKDVAYRVRHGKDAKFDGLVRKDPIDKDEILVANLSCNSSRSPGERPHIVAALMVHDPDLLFFAGDQTYHHTQHTAGWLQFGEQFKEIMKDRPTICITDDHDIGQGNLWGEGGIKCAGGNGDAGGYVYSPLYVNMVQRQQTWNLPDAWDPTPVAQDIGVYYTRLRVGGIDFAILEDRKFKSGPNGKIPKMGPRADHINDPVYDRSAVDLPELKLLGDRQLKFLSEWGEDWSGADMKCVLSQTAFAGAVHKHGSENNRLLADLDSNAWPQKGRNKALREIRRVWAPHLCGDQHLAVSMQHGIENFGDGPYSFTSPALINTIYGRWWHPEDEKAGPNAVAGSSLPWTGDYLDGLGNKLRMLAYANPPNRSNEQLRADGYGLARFEKSSRTIHFECYKRFPAANEPDNAQFPGWPITFKMSDNDGRKVVGHLPELVFEGGESPVVQVIENSSGEILYTIRIQGSSFKPQVYSTGEHTVKVGQDSPTTVVMKKALPGKGGSKNVSL